MDKCNWKDGKFESYDNICASVFMLVNDNPVVKYGINSIDITFCPFCGADIRKPEPEVPSHGEIMSLWWKVMNKWYRVTSYNSTNEYEITTEYGPLDWAGKSWFMDRQSATIPPE